MLSNDEEKNAVVHIGTRHILFELENTTVVSRLLEGEFLKYKNSIPRSNSFTSKADTKALLSAVESVSILIDDKLKNPIRMKFDQDAVRISCATGRGRGFESISVHGGELEIGFNHRYILDALRHVPNVEVRMEAGGPLSAFLFLPPEGEDYLFMVLPVRLKAE